MNIIQAPYQGYALMPITNLAGFSKNKLVKKAAQDILDHLSETYLTQSAGMIRNVPFRRQIVYETKDDLVVGDGEIARHAYLTGITDFYRKIDNIPFVKYGKNFMLITAIADLKLMRTHFKSFSAQIGSLNLQRIITRRRKFITTQNPSP